MTELNMERYHNIAKCMDRWMSLREKNHSINAYFRYYDIRTIGIYGYGILGRHLVWEIECGEVYVSIKWILDKRAKDIIDINYPVFIPEDFNVTNDVDVIVVSAINDFDEIERILSEQKRIKVISLDSIIKECFKEPQWVYV